MIIKRRHWSIAFGFALLAHGSIALAFIDREVKGTANLGIGGLDVSFGTAGGAPGAAEVPPPEAAPVETPEAETAEAEETPPVEEAETVEAVEPVAAVPVLEADAEIAAIEAPEAKLDMVKLPSKPVPPREVAALTPPRKAPVEPAPKPETSAKTEPAEKPAETKTASTAPASVAGSAGKSGTKASADVGSGSDSASGGSPGSTLDYFALLQAWLEKHKEYPLSARRRRHEGVVMLSFSVDQTGNVGQARITRSSGYTALDEEALKMLERAAPLPPFPQDFTKTQIALSVPVQFHLR